MMHYFRRSKFLTSLWLVLYLSINLFYTPTLAGELEVDTHAPADQQPTVEKATNGIPIINITEPSPGGVSRNTFTEYNVAEPGVIFNNNPDIQPEDLNANKAYLIGEPLFANENLQGRAAEVILTEVTGVHISNLLGPTEIYGHSADFILANPNGIYCNGANFINANRVTLTTGQPVFDPQKALQQLSVKKGTIQIVGKGIQTRELGDTKIPTSPLEILSKVIEINSTLQHVGVDVYLYGGEQDFTYKNKQFTLQPSAKTKPANKYVAVDANLLGNIQANKIYIIATQQGVGVNSPKLLAKEEIEITASGDIRLKEVHTNKDLHVTSKDGDIQQEGDKNIVAHDYYLEAEQGNITLDTPHLQMGRKGQITSKQLSTTSRTRLWAEGAVKELLTLTLRVSDKFNNQGKINVTQLVASPMQELINTGKLHTQKHLAIESQHIHQTGEIVASQGDIQLTGHQQVTNQGLILGQQGKLDLQGGIIHNTGKLSTKKQLTLSAISLEQQGTIEGKGVKLAVHGALKNSKDIYSQGELTITSGSLHNSGELKADKQLNLTASSLEQAGTIDGKGVKLTVQMGLKNSKDIYSQGELAITSGQFHNLGKVIAINQLAIRSQSLQNDSVLHTQQGNITLDSEGTITNTSEISSKVGIATLKTPARLTNQGTVLAHQNLILEAGDLENNKIIQATTGNIILKASGLFTNRGTVISHQDLTLEADDLENNQAIQSTTGQATLKVSGLFTNRGQVIAHQNLNLEASDLENNKIIQATTGVATIKLTKKFTNQQDAAITSAQNLTLQAPEVINQGDITSNAVLDLAVNNLFNKKEGTIQATNWKSQPFQQITNKGILSINHDIDLVTDKLTNTGILCSQEGQMKLQVNQDLVNEKEITSQGAQTIHVTGKFTNQGTILAKKEQTITADQLDNMGNILSQEGSSTLQVAQQLDNTGKIRSHQGQEIQAATLINRGEIASEVEALTITLEQDLYNEATLHTPTHLAIKAKSLTNNQKIYTGGTGQINLTGQLTNHSTITSNQDLEIQALEVTNSGEIQSKGGATNLAAVRQLTNKNLITSEQDLTLETPLLLNQGNGRIHTNQVLHLNNLRQLTNAGKITAATIQQVGGPVLDNQGTLQTTAELTLTLEDLQNAGTIQSDRGSVTIHSNQQITHTKGALLHGQQGMSLTAGGAITNAGALQTEKGELTMEAVSFTNEGQLLAPTIKLTATQVPLTNYQAINSKTGSITLTTKEHLINKGRVTAHQDLVVEASEVENYQTMQAPKGKATFKIANKLANQSGAKIASEQDMVLQVPEMINQGEITSRAALDLTANNLLNKKEGLIQASHWKSQLFQQITNEGALTIAHDIDLVTDKLTNTGILSSQQGGMKLRVNQDLVNDKEIISQGEQILEVGGKLTNTGILCSQEGQMKLQVNQDLVNDKEITSQGAQTIHVTGKFTNQGTILSKKEQTITANQLGNTGIILSKEGGSTLQVAQQLDNAGKIRSHQGQEIQAATLINRGEIASEVEALTIRLEQDLHNEATLHTPTHLTIKAKSLTNNQKIYTGGTGKITLADQLTNHSTITGSQDLAIQAAKMTNDGEIQSQKGPITLIASRQLTNKNLITSEQDLTLETPILLNQDNGRIHTNQILHLNNLGQLTNVGKVTAATIQQTGNPVLENQGMIQTTADLALTLEDLQNTGTIQSDRGSVTIHSNQQITQEKGALLHGQQGISLTAEGAITNAGTLQTEKGELTVEAASITNEGQLLAPTISLTATQGPLINYQAINSKAGSITLKTKEHWINRGQVMAHQDLVVEAGELENYQTMQATSGTATIKLANKLANQPGAKIASEQDIVLQVAEVNNQGEITSRAALDLTANNLLNKKEGLIQAVYWKSQPFQQIINAGTIKVFHDIDLITDKLTNTGALTSQQGGMKLHVNQDLENEQEIISHGAQDLVVKGKMTNKGTLKAAALKLQVDQDLINEKEILSPGKVELQVTGKLTNSGKIQGDEKQDITAGDIENQGDIHSTGTLNITTTQHTHNTGSMQGGEGIELRSNTLTNTSTGHIRSDAHSRITTQGILENSGKIEGKQDIKLTSKAGTINNRGTIHSEQEAKLEAQGEITNSDTLMGKRLIVKSVSSHFANNGTLKGQKLIVEATLGLFTNNGTLQPVDELTIQAKDILNNQEISSEAATLELIATNKITNNQPIKSKKGGVQFKSRQVDNHSEIASESQLTMDTRQLTNHAGAALISHQKLNLQDIDQVDNAGKIYASNLVHTGFPVFINQAKGEVQTHNTTTLTTQNFINKGNITVTKGDLTIQSKKDITQEQGKLTTQAGNITLQALAGNLTNQGDITSSNNIQVDIGRTLQNNALLGAKNDLTIQAHTLNNAGEMKATGATTLNLQDKLHNKTKIASGGNLTISQRQASLQLLNEGTLESGSTLAVQVRTLTNQAQGKLQAKVSKIEVTDSIANTKGIQATETLTITAGKLANSGEIGANQALNITILQGDIDNRGTLASSRNKVKLDIKQGSLYNTSQLTSHEDLEIRVARALQNKGKVIAGKLLSITAPSVNNSRPPAKWRNRYKK